MGITHSKIIELSMYLAQVRETQTDPELTNKQVVKELRADITALRVAGFSFERIADILKEYEVSIAPSTLKSYLQDASREKANKNKPKKQSTIAKDVDLQI